jgi:flagella basal body P-ring formation protein FlgA
VRSAVASRLVSFLKADPADVRLAFAVGDERLLGMDGSGCTLDIQPTGLGSQVPVLIRVFEGDRIAAAGTVRVRAEQRREVVAARESLKRGDVVSEDRVIAESRWVVPGERYAAGAQVIGMVVKNRIEPGQVFVEDDVEPAVVIRRGDVCTIACLSGSIVLNVKARAMANGREGETIEFAPMANPRTRVRAKVLSAGQAVINASAPEDHVFGDAEVAQAEEKTIARAEPAKVPASAEVGTIQVQRVTERPDGSIIVEAKTPNGKRPTKKMRFLPLDE